jgi:hypothetical protein
MSALTSTPKDFRQKVALSAINDEEAFEIVQEAAYTARLIKARGNRFRSTQQQLALYRLLRNIIGEHAPCTVRQVYYLAVVAALVAKDDDGYNLVQRSLLGMRRSGLVPYSAIRDNARSFYGVTRYHDLEDFGLYASRHLFALDYWRNEPHNVEIWVESDSIAGTLMDTVINHWGLRLFVARGFSSETYLYNAGEMLKEDGREAFIYLLSDFDPAGYSLAEDIARKLQRFAAPIKVNVARIALSGDQVRDWRLPTHDLKKGDKRAKGFRVLHGDEACELEAIPPNQLRALVSEAISAHTDPARFAKAKRDEELQRESLKLLPEWFRRGRGGQAFKLVEDEEEPS